MANKTFQGRIVQKHDTEANWKKATNFIPLKGEIIIYDDLNKIKIGDGSTKINDLKFSLAESDLYICTVTASGTGYTADKKPLELLQASTAGKIVVAMLNNAVYFFAGGNSQMVRFTRVQNVDVYVLQVTITGTATLETTTLQQYALIADLKANKDNKISYPSAKAVYDAIPHPDAKTNNQTQTVGIDANGKLWTNASAVTNVNGKTGAVTVREVPAVTTSDNGKSLRVVNGAWTATTVPNKFTFTATAGQSTFTIPFDFEDSSALTIYYNGVMMKETDNYTVSGKVITLAGFTAEAGDYLTVMGIEGAAAIDFGKDAEKAIAEINATKKSATTEINTTKESATTEINDIKTSATNEITTVKTKAIKDINDLIATLPSDTTSLMFVNKTNTMAANSKITMDSKYTPSDDYDIATKKYVDQHVPKIDPAVGTTTKFSIYIGATAPAANTTPLLWIDTSSSGTFKYRTNTSSTTWTPVPVAWG